MLILIRGLPGSGKSTLAKFLLKVLQTGGKEVEWFETDMAFTDPLTDEYKFDPEKLKEAHEWCQRSVRLVLERSQDFNVIVSNTFSRIWEMQPYLDMAKELGHEVIVHDLFTGGFALADLWSRCTHNVPVEVLVKMIKRWEKYE